MRNALAVLILLVLTAVPALAQFAPEIPWETRALRFQSVSTAGTVDSMVATLTSGELDTSAAFPSRVRVHMGTPDSLQYVGVWVQTILPATGVLSSFDSADSVYLALDGSADNGVTWRTLTTGIGINGFGEGAAFAGSSSLRGFVLFNGAANSATNVLGRSPGLIPTSNYGGWYGWPLLRVRTMASAAAFQSSIQIRLLVTYPADKQ